MRKVNFYDLDGTLSKLNNTFDFIKLFHTYRRNKIRLKLSRTLEKILYFLPLNQVKKRRLLITLLFYNLKKESLNRFYDHIYKKRFQNSLTKLGKKVLSKNKKDNKNNYLITGCVEIPAKKIGKDLLFSEKNILCTTFKLNREGRIKGIKKDSFGDLKLKFVKEILNKYQSREKIVSVYFTDDVKTETDMINYFEEVYYVKGDKYDKIK